MNKLMREVLENQSMGVLSTSSENQPHCSLMAYILDEQLTALYLVTHKDTRKFTNIRTNPKVSLMIDTRLTDGNDNREKLKALTITGKAQLVSDASLSKRVIARFGERHPHLQEFAQAESAVVMKIKFLELQLLEGATNGTYVTCNEPGGEK